METKEFNQLESVVMELIQAIKDARQCYYNENWLSDRMYKQVFLEKIKEMKEAIDEATKDYVF